MTSPSTCASLVAPQVDRLRIAMAQASKPRLAELVRPYELDDDSAFALAMMRNVAPSRAVVLSDFERVFIYQSGLAPAALRVLRARGLVDVTDSTVRLTGEGASVIAEIQRVSMETARERWSCVEEVVAIAHALVSRALESRPPLSGAYAVLAPPHEHGVPASDLAEQLSSVRFHRFDAHIDAWQALGLTVEEVRGLEGVERDALEEDTNRRDGQLWEVLDPGERDELVEALTALPSS